MTDWVDEQLQRWGRYSAMKERGVMGYPGISPTFRIEASGSCTGAVDLVDATILKIDNVIAGMGKTDPELYLVACCWYVLDEPVSTIARRSRCHRDTIYSRLKSLKASVGKALRPEYKTSSN